MTVKEAAEYLQLSVTTIYRLCAEGVIRSGTVLHKKLLNRDDVERLGHPV